MSRKITDPIQVSKQFWIGVLGVPAAMLLGAASFAYSIKNELPKRLPVHWGNNGPDRFGSLNELVLSGIGIGLLVVVLLAFLASRTTKEVSAQRMLIVTNNFISALLSSIVISTVFAAKGLVDASDLTLNGGWIAFGIIGGIALGAGLAFLIPKPRNSQAATLPSNYAPRTSLNASESGVWVRREVSLSSIIVGGIAVLATAFAAIETGVLALLILPVVLAALLGTMFVWDFRIDPRGLTCSSGLKIFKRHIPFDQIIEANVVDTRAIRDFGGWGWRTALDGATGIILKSGESLELKLTDDRVFVLTTKDAHNAAGLLNTLIERTRTQGPSTSEPS